MNKSHGPSFRKQAIELKHCTVCRGKGVVRGISYELECAYCHASGWVDAWSGEALLLPDLVLQMSLKLQAAEQMIRSLQRPANGPGQQYEQNNRRGAGGSNFTGD